MIALVSRAKEAGKDVAAAAFGHAGVAGWVDDGGAVRRADDAVFAFEDDDGAHACGQRLGGGDAFAVVGECFAIQAGKFAGVWGENAARR